MEYPDCVYCDCEKQGCAEHFPPGTKVEWPELVGVKGRIAAEVVRKENNMVWPWIVPKPGYFPQVFCCNRVLLIVDSHHVDPEAKVLFIPKVW